MALGHNQKIELEQKLIESCKENNRRAQLKLYKMYSGAMFNVSLNFVNERYLAEDIMQEAFISAFCKLDSFKGEVTFGAWLKKITINKCLDYLKKKKENFVFIDNIEDLSDDMDPEDESQFSRFTPAIIKNKILQLPNGYRTILNLYLFEGYDHQEIAKILGISASTSRSQYARAKAALIKKINE